jgi:hypothetical protein
MPWLDTAIGARIVRNMIGCLMNCLSRILAAGGLILSISGCYTNDIITSYYTSLNGARIIVEDRKANLRLSYDDGSVAFIDAMSDASGAVRCSELARNVVCVNFSPIADESVSTSDGGSLRARFLGKDEWEFRYVPLRAGENDCQFAIWSMSAGVREFGVADCFTWLPRTSWQSAGPSGFYSQRSQRYRMGPATAD